MAKVGFFCIERYSVVDLSKPRICERKGGETVLTQRNHPMLRSSALREESVRPCPLREGLFTRKVTAVIETGSRSLHRLGIETLTAIVLQDALSYTSVSTFDDTLSSASSSRYTRSNIMHRLKHTWQLRCIHGRYGRGRGTAAPWHNIVLHDDVDHKRQNLCLRKATTRTS